MFKVSFLPTSKSLGFIRGSAVALPLSSFSQYPSRRRGHLILVEYISLDKHRNQLERTGYVLRGGKDDSPLPSGHELAQAFYYSPYCCDQIFKKQQLLKARGFVLAYSSRGPGPSWLQGLAVGGGRQPVTLCPQSGRAGEG